MKILMVGWVDFRVSDAGSIHFSEIANAFYRLGNEVDVFVPKANAHAFFESRIKIIPMQNRMKETLTTAFWANVKAYIRLPFLLKKKKYDCVYFRWRMFPCGFLKIFTSSKIVTEHNGWIELEAKLQHSNKMISKIGKYLQLLDAQYADAIICVTDGIRKQFIQNQRKENHY